MLSNASSRMCLLGNLLSASEGSVVTVMVRLNTEGPPASYQVQICTVYETCLPRLCVSCLIVRDTYTIEHKNNNKNQIPITVSSVTQHC